MSTFSGKISHFPLLSIDRFDGDHLKSEIFLLSHCHEDHMIGLRNPEFKGPLYLSPVSAVFVRQNFPHIRNLQEITNGIPVHIKTSEGEVVLTAFPANHCPGSVMFLLENDSKRVLYTGDFRLNLKELQKIIPFNEYRNSIDEIYLDSTFLRKNYENFPSQKESCEAIATLIKEWTSLGSNKKILLHISARYGYEWMFIQLFKRLKMKILVKTSEFTSYRYIPELDEAITHLSNSAQIHACNKNLKNCDCNAFSPKDEVRTIRVSAMIWQNWDRSKSFVQKDEKLNEFYRVCYSNHASLSEIRDLLRFLRPKEVFLNVIPLDKAEYDKMTETLNSIMKEFQAKNEKIGDLELPLSFSNISKVGKKRLEMEEQRLAKMRKLEIEKVDENCDL
ncbi:protein artemis-like [Culicoides brevitarsis]|uniref:protein artemis-like n=1 Tax=Culicoides brevitarsis TaxID=469753 RepID=UPI00307B85BA